MKSRSAWIVAFAQFFSLAVIGIAMLALLGHAFSQPVLYTWRGAGATAIPTASMLLLLSLAVLFLASRYDED